MSTPGWYPNPDGSDSKRFWDGRQWGRIDTPPPIPEKKMQGWQKAAVIAAAVIAGMYAVSFAIGNDPKPETSVAQEPVSAEAVAGIHAASAQSVFNTAISECKTLVTGRVGEVDFPDEWTQRNLANGAYQVRGIVGDDTEKLDFTCSMQPGHATVLDRIERG